MAKTTNVKLSDRMAAQLRWTAQNKAGHNGVNPTTEALIRRGLVETVDIPDPTVGYMYDLRVTPAGWAWLKENLDMDRPADPDRLSLEDALELAYSHNGQVDTVDAWLAVQYTQDRERREAGRLSLEAALMYADIMRTEDRRHYRQDSPAINWPDAWTAPSMDLDAGRLSLEDAVAVAYTPAGNPALPTFRVAPAPAMDESWPAGTRVRVRQDADRRYRGRVGTVSADNRGVVDNPDHQNYGRSYVSVYLDPAGNSTTGVHTRQFTDDLEPAVENQGADRLSLEDALAEAAGFRAAGSLATDRGVNWPAAVDVNGRPFYISTSIINSAGTESLSDPVAVVQHLESGFLHQHHDRQTPTHHAVCPCAQVSDPGRFTLEQAWDDVTVFDAREVETDQWAGQMYSETAFLARLVDASRNNGRLPNPQDDPSGLTLILVRMGLAVANPEPRSWGRAVTYRLTDRGFHRASIIRSVPESTPESREAERNAAAIAEANRMTRERDDRIRRVLGMQNYGRPYVPGSMADLAAQGDETAREISAALDAIGQVSNEPAPESDTAALDRAANALGLDDGDAAAIMGHFRERTERATEQVQNLGQRATCLTMDRALDLVDKARTSGFLAGLGVNWPGPCWLCQGSGVVMAGGREAPCTHPARPDLVGPLPDGSRFVADHKTDGDDAEQDYGHLPVRTPGTTWTDADRVARYRRENRLRQAGVITDNRTRLAKVADALEQDRMSLSLEDALEQAYTPTGQPVCQHLGWGVNDSCPFCGTQDPREPYTVIQVERDLRGVPVSYYGVPIPEDLAADWTGYGAICWARGVQAARA